MKDILLAEKRDGIPCVIIFPCFNTPKQTNAESSSFYWENVLKVCTFYFEYCNLL